MISTGSPVSVSPVLRLAVVIPVFNDWESLSVLVPMLDEALAPLGPGVALYVVNDCSTRERDVVLQRLRTIDSIAILHLVTNVGHQRAISIGIAEVVTTGRYSHVLVMDSDGEDLPGEAMRLIQAALNHAGGSAATVVAQRRRRSEGIVFRAYYLVYKVLFRFLSGQTIDFGNFSLLPIAVATRLIHSSDTWNHFAASLVKTRTPLIRVPTTRGRRLAGRSTMNLVSLVTLGLSAISVYSEAVFVRMLLTSLVLLSGAFAGVLAVIAIRLFTSFAIPGWATTAGGLLGIILMQALTLSTIASFLALSARSGVFAVPALDAARFVERREIVVGQGEAVRS
ncbi:MAG: glycosyl transferase [Candidatus Eremiobacteraeota bacterium]|nr:glycosyl transferase [Candidatus Eremiobacteraeota bacterium]